MSKPAKCISIDRCLNPYKNKSPHVRAFHFAGRKCFMGKISFKFSAAFIACALLAGFCFAGPASPYAGQQDREIKALSAEDIQSYLAGKGMGFAKAAELNGYPGPAHVLSLADALSLTAEQKEKTAAVFQAMETRAMALGRSLIDQERELDLAFAGKSVTRASLEQMLGKIAVLQAQLRRAHLEAHLEQAAILTPVQIAMYGKLRGYDKSAVAPSHGGHAH
jgi:Spy/CpxP family protein refolding chaperone